ncbi:PEP-CTERM sorting domain-containing protein [Eleftheria terrae]|uniref:PEP-CTERM sorting domain-containing protein n=1 Tax=Eleftheria terrae TaxID=1597781 RepID=UPI00263B8660|nr:PEP-CTERM sorting domain-containing protein [Eleftheria terrae]WKB51798.1 PEP-CTERM sorting domain-containing protein [Eleftheria terrae]
MTENHGSRSPGRATAAWLAKGVSVLALAAGQAFAVPPAKTAGVALISVGATALTAGAGSPLVGAFQIGWGIGCVLFDPPDLIHAGDPVDLSAYSIYKLPDVRTLYPDTPTGLAVALNSYSTLMDGYLANVRAQTAAMDRRAGALELGREDWAAERWEEAVRFNKDAMAIADVAAAAFPSLLSAIDYYDPGALDRPITLEQTLAMRDLLKAGEFPAFEQFALDAWQLTDFEKAAFAQRMGAVSDADIAAFFDERGRLAAGTMTAGDAMAAGTSACSDCLPPVPEPSTVLLLSIGLIGLMRLSRRNR